MELTISKLTKQFKQKRAVDQVNVILTPGIIGLLGANGSGKTTLMRLITDIIKPDSGEVLWNGTSIHADIEGYLSQLGYLPQHMGAYPSFQVEKFLNYIGALKGLKPAYTKQRIDILLSQLHLQEQRHKKIKTLSGGMKQRLGIAQAMLNDPAILILDEPTVGLDPKERNQFSILLSEISKEKIILLSTHIVTDIENIADKIAIMKNGSFLEYDTPDALLAQLQHKVYEKECSLQEMAQLQKTCVICSQKNNGATMYLRFISETPLQDATNVPPILNDVYLYHFKEEAL